MLETDSFYKSRFYFYLSFVGVVTSLVALAFIAKLFLGQHNKFFVDVLIIVVLITVASLSLWMILKLCKLKIILSGVEIKSSFYSWEVIEKIVFLANGFVIIKFKDGSKKLSLLNYRKTNFADFFNDISTKVKVSKYGFRWHPMLGKNEADSPFYDKNS